MCRLTALFGKGLASISEKGFAVTWYRTRRKLCEMWKLRNGLPPLYSEQELEAQRIAQFSQNIKFSILVPLYNTPERFLEEMIESVLNQTYENWELCLADGSDETHRNVQNLCKCYAQNDARICYKKLEKNCGISGNTNACLEMVTGEYIALFDHDDLLHPAALYEVMTAISEKSADYVYTDEAIFEGQNVKKITSVHRKPDFAPDDLIANNYICHLSVFSRKLLETVGQFRPEYDGSQDHDIILRLTKAAKCVVHIPKVLYFWRAHPQSVAQGIGAKSYAVDAAIRAVGHYLYDNGYEAEVESSWVSPTIYRVRYHLEKPEPKVSILIVSQNNAKALRSCVNSILSKSTYTNYEILIADCCSTEKKTIEYYGKLKNEQKITVISYTGSRHTYAAINSVAENATGDYLVILHDDTEVIAEDWIQEMLMYAQRADVGAVGAMLLNSNNTVQSAGLTIDENGEIMHPHVGIPVQDGGYMGRLGYAQDVYAVSAACMMLRSSIFTQMQGFKDVTCNADVELCMRLHKAQKLVVWTPHSRLYHFERRSKHI